MILIAGRRHLAAAEEEEPEAGLELALAAPVLVAGRRLRRAGSPSPPPPRKLAAERGAAVQVLHVHETDVLGEQAVDRESREMAAAVLARRLAQLRERGRARRAARCCTRSATTRTPCRPCCDRVDETGAQVVVVGRKGRVAETAKVPVVVVRRLSGAPRRRAR